MGLRFRAAVFLLSSAALFAAADAFADEGDASHFFSLDAGVSQPKGYVDFTSAGGGRELNGKTGLAGGLQYLYHPRPSFGFGVEIDESIRGKRSSTTLVPNGTSTIGGDSLAALVVMRLVLAPSARLHPYLLLGGGVHSTRFQLKTKPAPGFTWADTGTTEERTLYNSRGTGSAVAGRVGLEFPLGDVVFGALEGGATLLGRAHYKPTPQGAAIGYTTLQGTGGSVEAHFRLGVRF